MPGDDLAFLRAELEFFDAVTGISGALYKVLPTTHQPLF